MGVEVKQGEEWDFQEQLVMVFVLITEEKGDFVAAFGLNITLIYMQSHFIEVTLYKSIQIKKQNSF